MFYVRTLVVSICPFNPRTNNSSKTFLVKKVYYPKFSDTRDLYEKCRNASGGYGGLLSATFYTKQDATNFFDNLDTVKGPSLGTNFTLRYALGCTSYLSYRSDTNSSPYVILAHYGELDWVSRYVDLFSRHVSSNICSGSIMGG